LSVVDETVENGVGIGRIADHGMPALDGELAGDEYSSAEGRLVLGATGSSWIGRSTRLRWLV
jgi:hypothetical protein